MTQILERVGRPVNGFRPSTEPEFFALQLARRLGEPEDIAFFLDLVEQHSREDLLRAYKRTMRSNPMASEVFDEFQVQLTKRNGITPVRRQFSLVSAKVERRVIGCAFFKGTQLEHLQMRQLSSDHGRADSSALGFVHWMLNSYEADSVALETVPDRKTRRAILTALIVDSVRDFGTSVWLVRKREMLSAYGMPPPRTRRKARETVKTIWPVLEEDYRNGTILDAAALGLYVQTERLFIH